MSKYRAFILVVVCLAAGTPAWSEGIAAPVAGDVELLAAFQREYSYLMAEKASLMERAEKLAADHQREERTLREEIRALERALARAQVANDRAFTEYEELEKGRKAEAQRAQQIASLWKRMHKRLSEEEIALSFAAEETVDSTAPANVSVADLSVMGLAGVRALKRSSQIGEVTGTFLDEGGRLVSGKVVRVGRIAAYGLGQGENSPSSVLGPGDLGRLKSVEKIERGKLMALLNGSDEGRMLPVYLFESLRERLALRKPSTWVESAASLAPGLFIALLFMVVAWLFFKLARA